jgi:hypothetical protein
MPNAQAAVRALSSHLSFLWRSEQSTAHVCRSAVSRDDVDSEGPASSCLKKLSNDDPMVTLTFDSALPRPFLAYACTSPQCNVLGENERMHLQVNLETKQRQCHLVGSYVGRDVQRRRCLA